MNDYERIEQAIYYIQRKMSSQPDLKEIANEVNLSPFHFQRLFVRWAGVSPKKFLQHLTIENAKMLLKNQFTIQDASFDAGLSGTSRLHDLFIKIEGMTPGEFKNKGAGLTICYQFANTRFGRVLIASTNKGICHLQFIIRDEDSCAELRSQFPNAHLVNKTHNMQKKALEFFLDERTSKSTPLGLHLKGTGFQLKVWNALLQIPEGNVCSYGKISAAIDCPRANRAVGSAIARNPVAYLIPCHRVIQSTGIIGQYRWGKAKKAALLGREIARHSSSLL